MAVQVVWNVSGAVCEGGQRWRFQRSGLVGAVSICLSARISGFGVWDALMSVACKHTRNEGVWDDACISLSVPVYKIGVVCLTSRDICPTRAFLPKLSHAISMLADSGGGPCCCGYAQTQEVVACSLTLL